MARKTMIQTEENPKLALDEELRRNGFQIWERPRLGEPIWVKSGAKFKQTDAVKQIAKPEPETAIA